MVPKQLQNPDFRFFLAAKNGKLPIEKAWNSVNSYTFFNSKLANHKGNIGVVTGGISQLIVIDFDERSYYDSINPRMSMPYTFCVKTANKRMYHLYYILRGQMFKKTAIRSPDGHTLCDIQADGAAIICPPSSIDGKQYEVVSDVPIAEITLEQLQAIFKFVPEQKREFNALERKADPVKFNQTIAILAKYNIHRGGHRKFKCPFHHGESDTSLYVFDDGGLKCFAGACNKYWSNVHYFVDDLIIEKSKVKQ